MAFTIKGLARRYELEEHTAEALAELWQYWVSSNNCDYNCVYDFLSLRKSERAEMMGVLVLDFPEVANYINRHADYELSH